MTGTSIVDLPSLIAAAKNFGNRIDTSVANAAADFVRLGEDLLWFTNEGGVLRSEMWGITQGTITIQPNQNWAALPADFLGMKRLTNPANLTNTVNGRSSRLDRVDADALEDLVPGNATQYAIEGGRLIYGGAGTSGITLNIRYYAFPGNLGVAPPLGGAALSTTWALQKVPSLYLYAVLLAMALYVKKMDAVGQYGALLDKSLAGFQSQERLGMESGSTLRYQRTQGS